MRRRLVAIVVVGVAAAGWCVQFAGVGAADAAVARAPERGIAAASWRHAIEVPGLGALNVSGSAFVDSVSCASAGNCSAGGGYRDGSAFFQAFVVSERSGRWGKAIKVPGTGTLNAGGDAVAGSVSCGSVGNCSAGGRYADSSSHGQAFVVNETSGHWGKAIKVPGTGTLNVDGNASVNSVSCASAGNCSAGGTYRDGSGTSRHSWSPRGAAAGARRSRCPVRPR